MTEAEVLFLKIVASFRIKNLDERKDFLENKEILYSEDLESDKLMICKDCKDLFFATFNHSSYLCSKCIYKKGKVKKIKV
jgi:hypothetical protein